MHTVHWAARPTSVRSVRTVAAGSVGASLDTLNEYGRGPFGAPMVSAGRDTGFGIGKGTIGVSGSKSVDDLCSSMEDLLPEDMAQEVLLRLSFGEDGMVNTSDVLSCVTKKFASRHRNSIRRDSDGSCC